MSITYYFMGETRWRQSQTSLYNLNDPIIFCPKDRQKVLTDGMDIRLQELIHQKCRQLELEIKSLEVGPDQVPLFVSTRAVHSPQFIVAPIKAMTAHELRKQYPQLKRKLPPLWTRSYYLQSVGHISEATIKKYIEDPKNK